MEGQNMDECREAFERFAESQDLDIEYVDVEDQIEGRLYCNAPYTQLAWDAWQAAWNARPPVDARKLGEWQPIETIPKDGTEVLTICMRDDPPSYEIDSWYVGRHPKFIERADGLYEKQDDEWGTWCQNGHRATHWMPLPKPPATIEQLIQGE